MPCSIKAARHFAFLHILYKKARINILFLNYVDWSGRRSTPAGVRGRGDPADALARALKKFFSV
jgi:hypothetical protein